MMQRLSIARAMMQSEKHRRVLFSTNQCRPGPANPSAFMGNCPRYNQSGKTILLTTHNMEEAERALQTLAIIDHGRSSH